MFSVGEWAVLALLAASLRRAKHFRQPRYALWRLSSAGLPPV